MAETLEDLLDKATNPSNIGDNSSNAVAFSTQVNKEFDGPGRAIKLLSQKLSLHQEAVSLQTLNVIESCVKNCGQRFHQEIGKYRFLNELIKLLSPKYDGDITSQAVKDRVIELMYDWYMGLPNENKIAEAYKMLKQQGVIKRDPTRGESGTQPSPRRMNTALDDEEKSQLLSTLLKSTNPDDLQAANRLIKTMVKQEEERLEKFSKRVQDLENVSNNVNLLNEMISAYIPSISESDQDLMRDLYEGCLNMRTQLFRMASQSAEDKDDTLSEILSLSDDLTKTIDEYKRVVIQGETPSKPLTSNAAKDGVLPTVGPGPEQQSADSLLDLGLDFNAGPTGSENIQSEIAAASSLLDEQFKMLGLDNDVPVNKSQTTSFQGISNDEWGSFGAATQQPTQHPPQQQALPIRSQYHQNNQFNSNFGTMGQIQPHGTMGQGNMGQHNMGHGNMGQGNVGQGNFHMAMSGKIQSVRPMTSHESSTQATGMAQTRTTATTKTKANNTKTTSNDLLGFDVFADFKKDGGSKINETTIESNSDKKINDDKLVNLLDETVTTKEIEEQKPTQTQASNFSSPAGYSVPLDAIEPTSHSPITTLDKDGVKTILNIVKDKRETSNPNVIVIVFSTISTNSSSVSEFKIEVSVPKAMKIKLQTPSATTLPPFNPLLPPSAITQIMLIANPLKEIIRMQIRISYKAASNNVSETVTIESLPVT